MTGQHDRADDEERRLGWVGLSWLRYLRPTGVDLEGRDVEDLGEEHAHELREPRRGKEHQDLVQF
jgi:hypothetical protein